MWLDQGTLVKGYKLQFLSFVIQRHCGIKSIFSSNIKRGNFLSSEEKATRFAPKDETEFSEFQSHHFILQSQCFTDEGVHAQSFALQLMSLLPFLSNALRQHLEPFKTIRMGESRCPVGRTLTPPGKWLYLGYIS